ncbi:MAG: glycosyltransferase [Veillonellaceae bacterium]|nr:glycosyltransferase [Veillonellaceae bacterium]
MQNFPKVSIAMAIYKPNTIWLLQQLASLNNQDYKGEMELLVWNDSPEYQEAEQILQQYITNFSFQLLSDGQNHGATGAFAQLTEAAQGKYIAYCDQDDIWLPEKISKAVAVMEQHSSCCICHVGMNLINAQGEMFQQMPYPDTMDVINSPSYQQQNFILRNFAFGCAMLVNTDFAKSVLPFPGHGVYHDQWLACCGAYQGQVIFLADKLLLHRIHDSNTSAVLQGITQKKDYYQKKLPRDTELVRALQAKFSPVTNEILTDIGAWIKSRNAYSKTKSWQNLRGILRGMSLRRDITIFETLLPFIPEQIFSIIIMLRKNKSRKD